MAPTSTPSSPVGQFRITVVCLGNICRSPIGEAVLSSRLLAAGLEAEARVDSAGTGSWNLGQGADPRAIAALESRGYANSTAREHVSRQITPTWFTGIDLVLAMDEANYVDLERLIARSGVETRLRMMRSFDPHLAHLPEPNPGLDVPDPYYGGPDGFVEALGMIERAADGLMARLPRLLP